MLKLEVSGKESVPYGILLAPLFFVFFIFFTASYGLLLNIRINKYYFIVSFLLSEVFIYCFYKQKSLKQLLLSSLLLIVPIFCMLLIYDRSFDGNAYHKLSVGLIKDGWNPVREKITTAIHRVGYFGDGVGDGAFYDGYPKATYIVGAVVYSLFDNIEAGKVYTAYLLISASGIVYSTCTEVLKLKKKESILVVISSCCNPVIIAQMFTFYNDGFLQLLFFIVCFEFINVYEKGLNRYDCLVLLIAISLAVNTKYSGMILMFIPCVVYFIFVIFQKKDDIKNTIILYLLIIFSSLIFLGVSSYIHNLYFYHNPFYTIIGKDKQDVYESAIPIVYRKITNFFKLLFSIFSPVGNNHYCETVILRIPFIPYGDDIGEILVGVDTRFCGWGVFFSGLFCISFVCFFMHIRERNKSFVFLIITLCCFIPSIFLNCLNTARYWPLMFMYPVYCVYCSNGISRNVVIGKVFSFILCILILGNSIGPCLGNIYLLKKNLELKKQLKSLKQLEMLQVNFPGVVYNLKDLGIETKYPCLDNNSSEIISIVDYYCVKIDEIK